ncbi:hypothetical protein PMI13_00607 [Chryseobacterium populi]|uniref:Uncharacterized protein n=1 Tax=Chryseobacterium populi TaxID=1144316 RepID=J2K4M5_9FLAO|nr:hypothetical protein PMI13_00607 [Chryseobacterium populi]
MSPERKPETVNPELILKHYNRYFLIFGLKIEEVI